MDSSDGSGECELGLLLLLLLLLSPLLFLTLLCGAQAAKNAADPAPKRPKAVRRLNTEVMTGVASFPHKVIAHSYHTATAHPLNA